MKEVLFELLEFLEQYHLIGAAINYGESAIISQLFGRSKLEPFSSSSCSHPVQQLGQYTGLYT